MNYFLQLNQILITPRLAAEKVEKPKTAEKTKAKSTASGSKPAAKKVSSRLFYEGLLLLALEINLS